MSQRRNRTINSSNDEVDTEAHTDPGLKNAVQECVRYLFCRERSKIPIKRTEILKHLLNTCQTPANQVNNVIVEANRVLKVSVFVFIKVINSFFLFIIKSSNSKANP
jgi:uncharacterized Rmd1/YagE family protein